MFKIIFYINVGFLISVDSFFKLNYSWRSDEVYDGIVVWIFDISSGDRKNTMVSGPGLSELKYIFPSQTFEFVDP